MLDEYIVPISIAFMLFPFIAFFQTLPYILHQYHKYGSIAFLRTIIVYSFILYLMITYFLVILPLPTKEYVAQLTTPLTQLVPFQFIKDIILNTNLILNDPKTYIDFLTSPCVYQVLYNILLFVPFGIYLRYYFKFSFKKTFFLSFLLSLFFELTQLSGLYFIYDRAYRLFDVDDLIVNTFGGILGYLITPFLVFFLPSRDEIDEDSYQKGQHISFLRRIFAFLIDNLISLIFSTFIITIFKIDEEMIKYLIYLIFPIIYFTTCSIIASGSSLGKLFLKIKIVNKNFLKAKWYQLLERYFLLYIFYIPLPFYLVILTNNILITSLPQLNNYKNMILLIVFMITLIIMILHMMIINHNEKRFLYEILSQTKMISTIKKENIEVDESEIDEANEEIKPIK